jgi:hypothetical protein
MRLRRRHRDDWWLPSGLAEVELFRFWEADLGLDEAVLSASRSTQEPHEGPVAGPEPSTAPLWWAAGLVLLVIVVALLV